MKEMYKDNAGNWHYGNKGEELLGISYSANSIIDKVDAIPVEWLLDRAQEYLIDRDITASEMKFVKKLIEEWRSLNG